MRGLSPVIIRSVLTAAQSVEELKQIIARACVYVCASIKQQPLPTLINMLGMSMRMRVEFQLGTRPQNKHRHQLEAVVCGFRVQRIVDVMARRFTPVHQQRHQSRAMFKRLVLTDSNGLAAAICAVTILVVSQPTVLVSTPPPRRPSPIPQPPC